MSLLTIEKDANRQNELTAKLDGVEIPLISSIKITSECGSMTYVEINLVAAVGPDGSGVLIKESALKG